MLVPLWKTQHTYHSSQNIHKGFIFNRTCKRFCALIHVTFTQKCVELFCSFHCCLCLKSAFIPQFTKSGGVQLCVKILPINDFSNSQCLTQIKMSCSVLICTLAKTCVFLVVWFNFSYVEHMCLILVHMVFIITEGCCLIGQILIMRQIDLLIVWLNKK